MKRQFCNFEIKAAAGEAGAIEGYASVFNTAPDAYGDVIVRGAYAASLERHKTAGTMPKMFWGHSYGEPPIGDWQEVAEDQKGLFVRGVIDTEDPVGARVYRAAKRGSISGLSIGYNTMKSSAGQVDGSPVRYLEELDLQEVSPVNYPAQAEAQLTAVKSWLVDGALPTLPQFERQLREAGFSKSQATAIAGKGLAPLLRGDVQSEDAEAEARAFLAAMAA